MPRGEQFRLLQQATAQPPCASIDLEPLQPIARQLFEVFPCPILLVDFRRTDVWPIAGAPPGALH